MKALRIIIFLLLVLFFEKTSIAQHQLIDTLLCELKQHPNDTARIKKYNLLSQEYDHMQNFDSAIFFCKEAQDLAERILKTNKDSAFIKAALKGKATSFNVLGGISKYKGNFHEAIDYHNKALEIDISINDKRGLAARYSNLSSVYIDMGNYPKGLELSLQALKINEQSGNKSFEANNHANIGLIYWHQQNFGKAIEHHLKSLSINESIKNLKGQSIAYGNIGLVYMDMKEYQKALNYYSKGLAIDRVLNRFNGIAIKLGNKGNVYMELGQRTNDPVEKDTLLKQAENCFQEAITTFEKLNNKKSISINLSALGSVYALQNKLHESELTLQKALSIASEIQSLEDILNAHFNLKELYIRKKDFKRSLEEYKLHELSKDSIYNDEKNSEITRHEMNFEFEKKETALKAEQEKKETLAIENKKKQLILFWLIAIIAVGVGVVALIIFRSLRITKKQKVIIERQKEFVEEKQKEIMDSIYYARRIQRSLLPTEKYIQKHISRLQK